jgi:mannose-6-phosphate isomerase-like protein (cupin superfamily)
MSGIIIPTGLSLVTKGHVTIKHRDREINLNEGEFAIVSNGTEHLPVAGEEVHVLLIEPKSTLNTRNVTESRTIANLQRL